MDSWTRVDAIRTAWVEADYHVREIGVAALKADFQHLLDELQTKDDLIVELQHQARTLRHDAAGWQAKYQNEKLLRERCREALSYHGTSGKRLSDL